MKKLAILLIALVCVSFVVKMQSEPKNVPGFKFQAIGVKM